MDRHLERAARTLASVGAQLDALSPLRVLERGYSVARDDGGRVLSRVVQFVPGASFRLTVRDGDVRARTVEGA
jgi:exodeoxyribonuclease VII large subunit